MRSPVKYRRMETNEMCDVECPGKGGVPMNLTSQQRTLYITKCVNIVMLFWSLEHCSGPEPRSRSLFCLDRTGPRPVYVTCVGVGVGVGCGNQNLPVWSCGESFTSRSGT